MAVTFAQAANLAADPVRRGALETAVEVSPVWDRLPWESIQGNAYAYSKDRVLPGTAFSRRPNPAPADSGRIRAASAISRLRARFRPDFASQ